jgi:hypothetical protein
MEFSKIISQLASETGVPLEVREGFCAFAVGDDEDDVVMIVLQDLTEAGRIAFWADLGAPDERSINALHRIALEANDLLGLTGGATLSVIPGSGHFRLQRIETLETLRQLGRSLLEGFIDTAVKWHQMVEDGRAREESETSDQSFLMMSGNAISI